MRNLRVFVVIVAAMVLGVSVLAQGAPGDIGLVYSVKPKLSGIMQLDAAMQKHFAWHRANKDVFSWFVWQVISGENLGDFVVGTFGHHWKDFDDHAAFDEKDDADFFPNVLPFVEKADLGYWTYLADASYSGKRTAPAAMAQVTHYYLKPDGFVQFMEAIREMRAAMSKAGTPIELEWWRLISGGEGPQLVLVIDHDNWADMGGTGKSADQMLVDAVGATKAVSILTAIRESTRFTRSYMMKYRPDISYIAPSMAAK
jgi:hypothetical protein